MPASSAASSKILLNLGKEAFTNRSKPLIAAVTFSLLEASSEIKLIFAEPCSGKKRRAFLVLISPTTTASTSLASDKKWAKTDPVAPPPMIKTFIYLHTTRPAAFPNLDFLAQQFQPLF